MADRARGGHVQGKLEQRLTDTRKPCWALRFDAKGERLASGASYPDGVRLWDLTEPPIRFTFGCSRGSILFELLSGFLTNVEQRLEDFSDAVTMSRDVLKSGILDAAV